MSQKVFKAELPHGAITVFPQGEKIVLLAESEGELGYIYAIDRETARMLHTDLGEMLGSFEIGVAELDA